MVLIGLDAAERLIDTGQASVNVVAAVPSLHAAYAALLPALFWERSRRCVRLTLLGYPVAMGAVLVLTGEHYVVDILAGFAVVGVVCWGARRRERRHRPPQLGWMQRHRTAALSRRWSPGCSSYAIECPAVAAVPGRPQGPSP